MNLILIRHGKTDAYLESKRQSPGSPLGEYGKKQAEALATKLHFSKIDHLYSSDWPRAIQTAEIISKSISKEVKVHPLVHEILKSPILDDIPDDSEINKRFAKELQEHKNDFDWKFDNQGESFNDVILRAKKVLKFLEEEHGSDTVAIVSHGVFIAALVALILLGPEFDDKTFRHVCFSFHIHNTGVSSFKYNPEKNHWLMTCFNDHSHLENES